MEQKLRLALYLKMFVGFLVGFGVAFAFRLPYSYTAGVITILHLWYSRDTVFKAALTRLLASVIGLGISALLFYLFGYKLINLFVMVLSVLTALYILKLEYGSTIALVLIGQQWADQTVWAPLNALFIMIIGTVPALILNFFTFRKAPTLETKQQALDEEIRKIFKSLADGLDYDFIVANTILKDTEMTLQITLDNYKVVNINEIFLYINTRSRQLKILEELVASLKTIPDSPYKRKLIAYLGRFQDRIGKEDYASNLLVELDELRDEYRSLPLPSSRSEFEERALLFANLLSIERFLKTKVNYHLATKPKK